MSAATEEPPVTGAQEALLVVVAAPSNDSESSADEVQLLTDAVRSLPSQATAELVSLGVCVRCIFRLFGIGGNTKSFYSFSDTVLGAIVEEAILPSKFEFHSGSCGVCFGILQFMFRDEKSALVKKESARDMARCIAELVKREGYQIDSFSLEVSIPQLIGELETTFWLDIKSRFGSGFQENSISHPVSIKDALKFALTAPLEDLLNVKSDMSSFRFRLTYTHPKAASRVQTSVQRGQNGKRQKTGKNGSNYNEKVTCTEAANSSANGTGAVKGSIGCLNYSEASESGHRIQEENEPCCLELSCYRMPIFIGGRYLKYSRNVSQTRWIIDEERMGEASVEEVIGSNILSMCRCDDYKFHAAGREDIDVRMLGSGRPFLIEVQNPRQVPPETVLKDVEAKINNLETKLVSVKNLKVVSSQGWELMREGEAEKQKQYAALVWISHPLEDKDLQSVSSLKDIKIIQRTPIRVLHRRSSLEREKTIHWMKIEKIAGSPQYFLLHLCTQAGTYIKEFVHGDLGRTQPSIGSILQCRAEILQLDVTDVKMDCF